MLKTTSEPKNLMQAIFGICKIFMDTRLKSKFLLSHNHVFTEIIETLRGEIREIRVCVLYMLNSLLYEDQNGVNIQTYFFNNGVVVVLKEILNCEDKDIVFNALFVLLKYSVSLPRPLMIDLLNDNFFEFLFLLYDRFKDHIFVVFIFHLLAFG